jgi:HSP20 family protein
MLTLWNEHHAFRHLHRDLDRLFGPHSVYAGFSAAVDVEENDSAYVLRADLPGFGQDDIDIRLEASELIISGTRAAPSERSGLRERRFGRFVRRFQVGPGVSGGDIAADYRDGVLTVTLPKAESAKARQIPVAVH